MPIKEALFWVGLTVFGTGLYFIIDKAKTVRWLAIVVTVVGAAALSYSIYSHYSEAAQLPIWPYALIMTWLLLALDIRYRTVHKTLPSKDTAKLVIHSAFYGTGDATDVSITNRLNAANKDALAIPVNNNLISGDPDPAPNQPKRLKVTYSYGSSGPTTALVPEHSWLILPQDPQIQGLVNEIERLKAQPKQPLGDGHSPIRQAEVLRTLPTYLQDLQVKLLAVYEGTTLDLSKAALFLKLSLLSDDDAGLRDMMIRFAFGERNYSEPPLDDLSGWILQTPFENIQYPYKSIDEKSLDTVSLWRDLQHNGLKAGLVKVGWLGVRIPDANFKDKVTKVRVEVIKTQPRRSYRFYFSQLTESDERVIDIDFRRPS